MATTDADTAELMDVRDQARIAHYRVDLRAVIVTHPQAYPALLGWLAQLNDPEINRALARRTAR